jgi:putative nucleotidyltransferase with HDIG domain
VGVLLAALAIAGGFASTRELDVPLAVALVLAYAVTSRVEFRVGSGVAVPTQLIFVPMLFLLPTEAVPLFVIAGALLGRLPEYLNGSVHFSRAVVRTAEDWYAVAPTLVLLAAGATTPDWSDWPVYLAALFAQFAFDFTISAVRERARIDIELLALWREFRTVYLVDIALSSIGLIAVFASSANAWAFVLVLPLVVLFRVFAHEREARIENALTLSSAYQGTAHLLGELLSTSHEYTGNHSRSVVVLAHQVGVELGLDETTLREIEFGALLHDVGKMAVPNEIINKPGRLTDEEWEVMKTHTIEGSDMLDRIGGVLAEVGAVVRSHHERFDGMGYPDGLRGDEIPIAARVITACDAFNAMTTHRPYSRRKTIDEAIAELRDQAGSQFDPGVVEAVVTIVETWQTAPGDPAGPAADEAPLIAMAGEKEQREPART